MQKNPNKLVSWLLYFIIYSFGHLAFTAYTQTHSGIIFDINNFFLEFFTYDLLYETIVIAVAALISSRAVTWSFPKTLLFTLVGTLGITIYRSFSYFFFFLRLDQILIIFFLLLLAGIIGHLFKFIYDKNLIFSRSLTTVIFLIVVVSSGIYGLRIPSTITPTDCDGFSDRDQRLTCFYALGIKNSDLDSCLQAPSAIMYPAGPECVRKALVQLEKENVLTNSFCTTLMNPEAQSICYYRRAVLTKDKMLCEKVVSSYTDENMSLTNIEPSVIGGAREIPNKQTCLQRTIN